MPPSSSSLQAARQRLADQLRELRLAAGLSGRAFAAAGGCQASKVSQIETNPRHYTFSSDPHTIRGIVAAFEMAWDRATPQECKAD